MSKFWEVWSVGILWRTWVSRGWALLISENKPQYTQETHICHIITQIDGRMDQNTLQLITFFGNNYLSPQWASLKPQRLKPLSPISPASHRSPGTKGTGSVHEIIESSRGAPVAQRVPVTDFLKANKGRRSFFEGRKASWKETTKCFLEGAAGFFNDF